MTKTADRHTIDPRVPSKLPAHFVSHFIDNREAWGGHTQGNF